MARASYKSLAFSLPRKLVQQMSLFNKNITIITFIVASIFLLSLYFESTISFSTSLLQGIFVLLLIILVIFFFTSNNHELLYNSVSPIILFSIGYLIVFFQSPFDLLLGNFTPNDDIFVSPDLILKTCFLSTCGLMALFVGYLWYSPQMNSRITLHKEKENINMRPLRILFIISSLFYILTLVQSMREGLVITQEVLEERAGGILNRVSTLFRSIYFSYLAYVLYNIQSNNGLVRNKGFIKSFGVLEFILFSIVVFLILLSGRRTAAFLFIISFIWSYLHIIKKKINLLYLVGGILLLSLFSTFIGFTRNLNPSMSLSARLALANNNDKYAQSFSPSTAELAGSGATLNYAISYVPQKHDYLYGSFHIRNLCSAIPFSQYVTRFIFDPDKKYISSAYFITYIIQGEFYEYGNGTSILADLYLNYGPIGVIIGIFLFGMFLRWAEDKLRRRNSLIAILLYLYLLSYVFLLPRYGILDPINYIAFSIIICLIYKAVGLKRVGLIINNK